MCVPILFLPIFDIVIDTKIFFDVYSKKERNTVDLK